MADVVLRSVRKSFGDVHIIQGVDLEIESGEFVVFVGPSGCGKSTLLRMIAGLEDITSGSLEIAGVQATTLPPNKRGVAMVFQSYALYPHMTVYENMAFGLSLAKESEAETRARVTKAAQILQLDHLLTRKPKELSGGQRQRVAIGRAIVRKPKVFLFDEPLSNLDASLRVQMRIEIARMHTDMKATMVYVTHDQVEAMTLADKIVVLNKGNVEQVGPPLELYEHPRNLFVAGFIGSPKMNFLECRLASVEQGSATVTLPGGGTTTVLVKAAGATPGDKLTLGIRPEHIVTTPSAENANLLGTVVVLEYLGDETFAYVETAGTKEGYLVTRLPSKTPAKVGDTLHLAVPAQAAHLFNADGKAFRRLAAVAPGGGAMH